MTYPQDPDRWYSEGRASDGRGSDGRGYDPAARGYESDARAYDPDGRGYEPDGRGFDSAARGFDSDGRGFDPAARGYDSDGRGYGEESRRGGSRHANAYQPDPLGDSFADQYRGLNPNSDVREYGTVSSPAAAAPPVPERPAMPQSPTMPVPQQPVPQPVSGPSGMAGGDPGYGPAGYPTSGGPGSRSMAGSPGQQSGGMPLDEVSRHHAESIDRTQLRRTVPAPQGPPPGAPGQQGPQGPLPGQGPPPGDPLNTGGLSGLGGPAGLGGLGGPTGLAGPVDRPGAVYRGKRPGLAALLIALTVLFEVPVFRIFFSSALADHVNAPGTISAIFMILGLPMFALGLYGLIGGAAATAHGGRAWLRVPLAYLPLGLALFLAAALAG